jgi:structural maintenance of chromosomes flexible hinge domain-containing protein 1
MPFGKLDWPPGCIDYVVNLIRPSALPSVRNLRATVFWTLTSRTLVFESLQQAEAYREVMLRIGGSCPDIITIDGSRLRGNGVVTGSSFSVPPINAAPFRFSQLPAAQARSECR